ncbi:MAG: hypothetical protein DRP83_01840 [Planctomycetota bacterium]|nr:MAG: hypothetical protein DRP83_01840 [Planctomycetota bacterium]
MRIERCLVDSGYLPGVIANACHKAPSAMMPSKGIGLTAGRKPMSSYRRHPGERHGQNWYIPNVRKTGEFRHVMIDTNYWKSFVHARLAPGQPLAGLPGRCRRGRIYQNRNAGYH